MPFPNSNVQFCSDRSSVATVSTLSSAENTAPKEERSQKGGGAAANLRKKVKEAIYKRLPLVGRQANAAKTPNKIHANKVAKNSEPLEQNKINTNKVEEKSDHLEAKRADLSDLNKKLMGLREELLNWRHMSEGERAEAMEKGRGIYNGVKEEIDKIDGSDDVRGPNADLQFAKDVSAVQQNLRRIFIALGGDVNSEKQYFESM
ncbi:hypothetical protein [Microbulbifer sp. JMSA003]|uniref:hypothetical protein n=1 Tax=unclassified Microbulbifer TaxID=2619833 RepID=UPI0040399B02